MTDLTARTPCDGLLPVTLGGVSLTEEAPGRLTSIAVYRGQEAALDESLRRAHSLPWPAPNTAAQAEGAAILWFGRGQAMLVGADPHPALECHAALVDQTDGWAVVRLAGAGAEDVLARLVPVDLRPGPFPPGTAIRSQLGHLNVSLWRLGDGVIRIMAFRSMVGTLVHDLKSAMEAVAARG